MQVACYFPGMGCLSSIDVFQVQKGFPTLPKQETLGTKPMLYYQHCSFKQLHSRDRWPGKVHICRNFSFHSNWGTTLFQGKLASSDLWTLHIWPSSSDTESGNQLLQCLSLSQKRPPCVYGNGYHLASSTVIQSYANRREKEDSYSGQKIK